jgi:tRNA (guanine37-N1)-methyltransferase
MRFHVLTLFPGFFASPLECSILGRACKEGHVSVDLHDIREHAHDRHRTVDDLPFGGGGGMVMKPDPVVECIEAVHEAHGPQRTFLLGAGGRPFDQDLAQELSQLNSLALVCGHYEGLDARIEAHVDGEIAIGDYVLTGGELGALVIIDAVSRLREGVLGNPDSPLHESFTGEPILEHPHYTRPREFRGQPVPDVLLNGDHGKIARWRRKESLRRTLERRPDLLAKHASDDLDRTLLQEIAEESSKLGAENT